MSHYSQAARPYDIMSSRVMATWQRILRSIFSQRSFRWGFVKYIQIWRINHQAYICVGKIVHRWGRPWLVACLAPGYYLNQWLIGTTGTKPPQKCRLHNYGHFVLTLMCSSLTHYSVSIVFWLILRYRFTYIVVSHTVNERKNLERELNIEY